MAACDVGMKEWYVYNTHTHTHTHTPIHTHPYTNTYTHTYYREVDQEMLDKLDHDGESAAESEGPEGAHILKSTPYRHFCVVYILRH
jgi:hypothetical protein